MFYGVIVLKRVKVYVLWSVFFEKKDWLRAKKNTASNLLSKAGIDLLRPFSSPAALVMAASVPDALYSCWLRLSMERVVQQYWIHVLGRLMQKLYNISTLVRKVKYALHQGSNHTNLFSADLKSLDMNAFIALLKYSCWRCLQQLAPAAAVLRLLFIR